MGSKGLPPINFSFSYIFSLRKALTLKGFAWERLWDYIYKGCLRCCHQLVELPDFPQYILATFSRILFSLFPYPMVSIQSPKESEAILPESY